MTKQPSFSDLEYANKKKTTRRERFLQEMDSIIPWGILVKPIKVNGDNASHPVLDNLKLGKSSSTIKYQSLSKSIDYFREQYPQGFYGEVFKEHERDYKDKASKLAIEQLGKEALEALISEKDYAEVVKRALKVANATNLIFPNEKMSLRDGLVSDEAQEKFSVSLFELLYGEAEIKERFETFSKVLEDIDAAKWTTASYFLFLLNPDKYMFLKPTVTQHCAEMCGFEINYKPQLNWLTYKSVLDFSNYLFDELSELKPRDMIDVQSFIWCIAP